MKLALVQVLLIWESPEENLKRLDALLSEVEADLIILPEMFTTGFTMAAAAMAPRNAHVMSWMHKMSQKKRACVMGSYICQENGQYYNRLAAVLPDGKHYFYDKRHLFTMASEHQHFTAGKSKLIFEWTGFRIAPMICYDLRFPVWSRNTAQENYDLLVYVANWPLSRQSAWDILLKARAIENLAYVAGVNRIGLDDKGIVYGGHSALIGPKGEVLIAASDQQVVLVQEINRESLIEYRNNFPAHLDSDSFTLHI